MCGVCVECVSDRLRRLVERGVSVVGSMGVVGGM